MIAGLAKVENTAEEMALINFLFQNGGIMSLKETLKQFDNNSSKLDAIVSSLEKKGQVQFNYATQKLSLLFNSDETNDEYTLQPDEMTKEMVRAELGFKNVRSVEMLKKNGEIPATKLRRRVDGEVRQQVIFKRSDVMEYKNKSNSPVNVPTVVKESAAPIRDGAIEKAGMNEQFINFFGAMFQELAGKIDNQPKLSRLAQISGAMFLDLDDAAKFSGIGKTRLETAIHEAEKNGLQRFSGERGKAVWRCEDLEKVIESIPPTMITKRLPPQKKKE